MAFIKPILSEFVFLYNSYNVRSTWNEPYGFVTETDKILLTELLV